MKGSIAMPALLVALLAATAASAASGSPQFVGCGKPARRPASIVVACADAGFQLRGLRWSSWGGTSAAATGKAAVNTCEPSCSAGAVKTYPVRITLSRVARCGRTLAYTRLTIVFTGRWPRGSRGRRSSTSYPCRG